MNFESCISILSILISFYNVSNSGNKDYKSYFLEDKGVSGMNIYLSSISEPNDTYYYLQNNLDLINYKEVYRKNKSSSNVRVAIIDSGIDLNNPDSPLNINESLSKSFSKYFLSPFESSERTYHGTAISGIIAARTNNSKLIAGISPNIEIVSVTVGHYSGNEIRFYNDELADAINYCSSIGVDIINFSIGGLDSYSDKEKKAIENFPGLFVSAAGNDGLNIDNSKYYPAEYDTDNMIVVGAVDDNGNKIDSSNYGKNKVDIFAPGWRVPSICSYDYSTYYFYSETSYATPHVVGVAASLMSEYPDLTANEVKNIILSTAAKTSNLTSYCSSGGILDASKIIHYKHDYSYSYEYIDTKYHYAFCECGERSKSGHMVAGGSFGNGNRYAKCLLCGGNAEMGFVVGPKSLNIDDYVNNFEFVDGLYYAKETQIIDGILNLSYEDYLSYLSRGDSNETN